MLAAAVDGRLPRARLEEAARRVLDLGADVAARRRVAIGRTDPGARTLARDVLLAVVEVHGCVRLGGTPHVLDLRTGANIAAGRTAPRLPAALRRRAPETTDAVLGNGDAAAVMAGLAGSSQPLVVVVDAPHRHPAEHARLETVMAARPDAVIAQTGLGDHQPLPGDRWVRSWGAGRAHAEVVADLLLDDPDGAP